MDSLNLAGDGDDGDLIEALERSFGLRFGEAPRDWVTVGDIYDALLERLPAGSDAGKCASSMAFYRLRAAIGRITGEARAIAPDTRLRDLGLPAPRVFHRRLRVELGVGRLTATMSWWGGAGALAVVLGVIGLFVAKAVEGAWPMILLLPVGGVMCVTDRGAYGERTVGDLAREIAANNFALLAQAGADQRPQAIWRALCEVVADQTDGEAGRIGAATRLIV